ncbi:MAG: CotH kinase family protein [Clostridia bacterium]|nr:CotH kinase family protein [Clostridia bacterium]
MSGSKHFDKIAWTVTAFILVVTILFMNGGALGIEVMAHTMGYENRLFDNTRVHIIDIVMDDWDEFIDNATSEEYYTAAVVVDGEGYKNVGIRGKGNTSLSSVSSMGSERYSFKLEFDHYDDSITYHGLDKLSLNNLIQDSTMMKDYLTYTMMNEFGAAAPLCSFVYITVNGEDWGLYLAVEGIEDSFLERNYGSDYGELYKPDSMSFGGGRGNGKDFNMDDFMNGEESADGAEQGAAMPNMDGFDPAAMFDGEMPDMGNFDLSQIPEGVGGGMPDMSGFDPSQMQGDMPQMPGMTQGEDGSENGNTSSFGGNFDFGNMGGFGGFGMGSSDVKLQYVDDNIDSYSNIWNNAKTDITTADQTRLMESLKKLSNKEQIESVVDIEQVIRYFVVHNYVCNGDSYTGSMIHNYYLYEENGQLAMLPWDYNLAYGTFQGGNGQSTINTPIDAPVSGGAGEDRPMWNWILSDESYTELYHQYFAEFLNTVDIQGIIDNAYNLIKSYVEKDPTAFFTYEEFETGVETMRQYCALRSESISMQLANGETTTNMNYVDASGITLSNMGSMSGMGGFGGMPDMGDRSSFGDRGSSSKDKSDKSGFQSMPGATKDYSSGQNEEGPSNVGIIPTSSTIPDASGSFDPSNLPEGFDPSQMQGGFTDEMPEGFDPSQMQGGFGGMFSGGSSDGTESTPTDNSANNDTADNSSRPSRDNMQMPGGSWGSNMNGMGSGTSGSTNLIWIFVSVLVLGVGLIIAKFYKRY